VSSTCNALQVPANHLLSASFMSAPAALAVSKLSYPETKKSRTTVKDTKHMLPTRSVVQCSVFFIVISMYISLNHYTWASLAFYRTAACWFQRTTGTVVPYDNHVYRM